MGRFFLNIDTMVVFSETTKGIFLKYKEHIENGSFQLLDYLKTIQVHSES